jgi:DNA-directed RNA polymerase subunit delta
MKKIEISDEELEMMNYNDIAYVILEQNKKNMTIAELFNEVSRILNLDENIYQSHIGDFFELLSTDKRFIMLEDGHWDLKIRHNKGMESFDDEDEDDEDIILDEDEIVEDEDMYDDDSKSDEDIEEDDLSDLVIVDDIDDESNL